MILLNHVCATVSGATVINEDKAMTEDFKKREFTVPLKHGDILLKLDDGTMLNTLIGTAQFATGHGKRSCAVHAGIALVYDNPAIVEVNSAGIQWNYLSDGDHKNLNYIVFRHNDVDVADYIAGLAHQLHDKGGDQTCIGEKVTYSASGAAASTLRKGNIGIKQMEEDMENEVGRIFSRSGSSMLMGSPNIIEEEEKAIERKKFWSWILTKNEVEKPFLQNGVGLFCSEFVTICIQYALKETKGFEDDEVWKGLRRSATAMTPGTLWEALEQSPNFSYVGFLQGGEKRFVSVK